MILTGNEIKAQLGGNIIIDPFDETQLNPNSYNLRLHNELLVYEEIVLDMRRPNRFRRYVIPEEGLVLNANQLYLGRTVERTETYNYVPMLEGRSSVGRLGLFVHITAGFGDVGFRGYWTLEMFAVQPVRVYRGHPDLPDFLPRPCKGTFPSTTATSTRITTTSSPACCSRNSNSIATRKCAWRSGRNWPGSLRRNVFRLAINPSAN